MLDEAALEVVDNLGDLQAVGSTALLGNRIDLLAVERLADLGFASRNAQHRAELGELLSCILTVLDVPEARMLGNGTRCEQAHERCLEQQHHDDVAQDAQRQRQAEALDRSRCQEEQRESRDERHEVGVDRRLDSVANTALGSGFHASAHTYLFSEPLDRQNG